MIQIEYVDFCETFWLLMGNFPIEVKPSAHCAYYAPRCGLGSTKMCP